MTVEGTIAEQDFASLTWSQFYRKPPIALLLIAVLAIGLFYSTRSGMGAAGMILPWSPLLVPLGLYFMVTHNGRRKYQASKMLRSRQRYTLEDAGIRIASDGDEVLLAWDKFGHWQDTRRFLMLYSSAGQVFLVDKAWFAGDTRAMLRFSGALDARGMPPITDAPGPPPAEGA